MMDLILKCGAASIIIWYLFTIVIPDHDEQNTKSNKGSDNPLPMLEPETKDGVEGTLED